MREAQIRRTYVAPPRLVPILGSIDTDQYSFSFGNGGRLCFITRLDAFGSVPMNELQKKLSKIASNMTTNQAYEIATNWLTTISVDVAGLEKSYPRAVRQHFFYDNAAAKIPLPIFDATWGIPEEPAVIVTIYAPTRELLQIREENLSFSRRPALHIDTEALLNISDTDFLRYTPEQRSNLVSHFTIASEANANSVNAGAIVTNSDTLLRDNRDAATR